MADSSPPVTPSSLRHPLVRTLLGLTIVTGMVDAVSFIALGSVFTANQTGNVVLLGLGVAGADGLEVLAPLASLLFFLAGAVAGGIISTRLIARHPLHVTAFVGTEVMLVGAAALLASLADIRANEASGDAMIALLAFAMGVRAACCVRIGVPDLSTTVVTLPMTRLMADSRVGGGSGEGTARRMAAVLAILAGAVAGALLVDVSPELALALAAGVSLALLLVYLPVAPRRV